ncbi:hypothetical protein QTI24_26680 [Variovorax sp. J22P240]|uniref:hypothetical protein n=1 Tax=Variovorax sp. J22P240 TaxID=3053514 RepID=UPI0025769E9B|nr:hypothetical protein [Variovorax sp. J22P240]MDM0002219.1 hypothetical protein [Variovorax sp. J22P240]
MGIVSLPRRIVLTENQEEQFAERDLFRIVGAITTTQEVAMATWFKRVKTKLWDGEPYKGDPNSGIFIITFRTPWARQFWQEHRPEIKKGLWTVFFGLVLLLLTKAFG